MRFDQKVKVYNEFNQTYYSLTSIKSELRPLPKKVKAIFDKIGENKVRLGLIVHSIKKVVPPKVSKVEFVQKSNSIYLTITARTGEVATLCVAQVVKA